jgi:hypothetical protein
MVHVADFRELFEKFMKDSGFKKKKRGLYLVDDSSSPRLYIEESFSGHGQFVALDTLVHLSFDSVMQNLDRFCKKDWPWAGVRWYSSLTYEFARYRSRYNIFSASDPQIQVLLGEFVDTALKIKRDNPDVATFLSKSGIQLDNSLPMVNPGQYGLLAIVACELELGHFERVRKALHWFRTDNLGQPLTAWHAAALDRVEELLVEKEALATKMTSGDR